MIITTVVLGIPIGIHSIPSQPVRLIIWVATNYGSVTAYYSILRTVHRE